VIDRPRAAERIEDSFRIHPATALLGPRQCGKTTLARGLVARQGGSVFDLESPIDRQRLAAPLAALEPLEGLVVVDEIQHRPELFELLRVLVDRPGNAARFLVLGSASPRLIRGVSETLAGRIGFVDLGGLDLQEVGASHQDQLWSRGGFPRSFLAADDADSVVWRAAFVRTFLERDLPQLGITIPAESLRRFWTMIAHAHGSVWNASALGRSLGVSDQTTRSYLDILAGAYVVRVLPPWFENLRKRQVKSPKVLVRDCGLLHSLLQIPDLQGLLGHPAAGASWEGFVVEQVLARLESRDAYFWAAHSGAELDLLVFHRGRRLGFEAKLADAPTVTRSMRAALADLALDHLYVVVPGGPTYRLDEKITVTTLAGFDPEPVRPATGASPAERRGGSQPT
jgi:predicted AAA+ superfamily ATPase